MRAEKPHPSLALTQRVVGRARRRRRGVRGQAEEANRLPGLSLAHACRFGPAGRGRAFRAWSAYERMIEADESQNDRGARRFRSVTRAPKVSPVPGWCLGPSAFSCCCAFRGPDSGSGRACFLVPRGPRPRSLRGRPPADAVLPTLPLRGALCTSRILSAIASARPALPVVYCGASRLVYCCGFRLSIDGLRRWSATR